MSKTDAANQVRVLGKDEIVGLDTEFLQKYVFYSDGPYKIDTLIVYKSFDYSLVSLASPNFQSWSNDYTLDKMIDRLDNTYMHIKRGFNVIENNPLTLIFDLGKEYYIQYIAIEKEGGGKLNLPKTLTVSYSPDS